MADTSLDDKSPAELHSMGLIELAQAQDTGADNAWGARKASTAIAFFFASMSADNLQAAARQAEKQEARLAGVPPRDPVPSG